MVGLLTQLVCRLVGHRYKILPLLKYAGEYNLDIWCSICRCGWTSIITKGPTLPFDVRWGTRYSVQIIRSQSYFQANK